MPRPRSSHEQKSRIDREKYFRDTIRRTPKPGPTVDELFGENDVTGTAEPLDTPTINARYESTRQRPSSLLQHLREKWPEIMIGLIGVVMVPVLGFLLYTVFTLNREVGELKIQLSEGHSQQERLETQIDKLNERLDRINEAPHEDLPTKR